MPNSKTPDVDIVVVSPHRDDAAFSCGVVLQAALETMSVQIVNIFTRSAYAPFAPDVEQQGVEAVTELRRQEDACSLHLLRAQVGGNADLTEVDLGLLDAPLRLEVLSDDVQGYPLDADRYEREVGSLASILRPRLSGAACVLLPLGLGGRGLDGHIDHRVARDAGRRCAAPNRISFYEDLPYAARMPNADRDAAIGTFIATLADVHAMLIGHKGAEDRKTKLAQCYASQVDATTIEEMTVYTSSCGGERVYAAAEARGILENLRRVMDQQKVPGCR